MSAVGTALATGAHGAAPSGVIVEPPGAEWPDAARRRDDPLLLGRPLSSWHAEVRPALGLPTDRPVVATGHQTLLWHPGILAKYLAVQAVATRGTVAIANLIVDQHAEGFGAFEAPARRRDGGLVARRFRLTDVRPGVPMALHPPFAPPAPPTGWGAALPSVDEGVRRIFTAVARHRDQPSAALQMGAALADLMARWVRPMPVVTASALLDTALGRRLLEAMADDPRGCAEHYNQAVACWPEAGIAPLLIRREYVELPIWRTRDDDRRVRGYDVDLGRWLEEPGPVRLFPRALLLTALVRLTFCDLFVHGTGGANYDRAMETWIERWLGVRPASRAVVSATLKLPLGGPDEAPSVERAATALRRAWHDPEAAGPAGGAGERPGPAKRQLLERIDAAPRDSAARRRLFDELHRELAAERERRAADLATLRRELDAARRRDAERPLVERRTWPFPLYTEEAIDGLAARIRS
ncbi:MAG: hypothetical protein ACYTJ0_17210 [Planctomycetota bacterium]|jgi:hypothetical protein